MKAADVVGDPLFEFELKVARRADELAHEAIMQGRNAMEIWREAERQTPNPFAGRVDSRGFRLGRSDREKSAVGARLRTGAITPPLDGAATSSSPT